MTTEIHHIEFGIYSPEEILKFAVCKLNNSKLIDGFKEEPNSILLIEDNVKNTRTKAGTVYDERMGTLERNSTCETCQLSFKECPGHFGYIELNIPIMHPLYIKNIYQFLKCFCHYCYRLILTEDLIELYGIKPTKGEACFKKIIERIEKVDSCYHCNQKQHVLSFSLKDETINIVHKKEITTIIPLDVNQIMKIFNNIQNSDVKLLGFDPKLIHPKNLILTILPVMPPAARPFIVADNICDDDLTLQLIEIIKINNNLGKELNEMEQTKLIQSLKFRVKTLMNNRQGKAKHTTSNRPVKCIRSRLEGKEGMLRRNLMGKRVNESARSVIGPDPDIRTDEISVPEKIAQELSYPVTVTQYNLQKCEQLVSDEKVKRIIRKLPDGKERIINVNYAINKRGTKLNYGDIIHRSNFQIRVTDVEKFQLITGDRVFRNGKFLKNIQYDIKRVVKLELGDVIERMLQDGDIVLLNRQPTLWRGSMLGQRVLVKPGKTLRFNLAICSSLNSDYDGDESNIFVPQSLEAEIELRELSSTKCNIVSSQSTASNLCIIQDGLLGSYIMTKNNLSMPKHHFFNICMKGDNWSSDFILKKIQHIKNTLRHHGKNETVYSSRHLFSMMLPDDFNYNKNNDDDSRLVVKRGVILSGALNKRVLGQKPESFIHILCKEYNDDTALRFINNVQFIVNNWLLYHGFSIGIKDCLASKEKEIEEVYQTCLFKAEEIDKIIHHPGIREMKINAVLCEARDTGLIIARDELSVDNNFVTTIKAGSKGDFFNITQIMGILGQQNLLNERIKPIMRGREFTTNSKRSLPHYTNNDTINLKDKYESKGFINHSFIHGLNPKEFFFHAMAAREGVCNTSLTTAKTGYNQRRIVKVSEDLIIGYDGTVRNSVGTIYESFYGGDGFDRSKMVHVNGKLEYVDVSRLCDQLNTQYELKSELS